MSVWPVASHTRTPGETHRERTRAIDGRLADLEVKKQRLLMSTSPGDLSRDGSVAKKRGSTASWKRSRAGNGIERQYCLSTSRSEMTRRCAVLLRRSARFAEMPPTQGTSGSSCPITSEK